MEIIKILNERERERENLFIYFFEILDFYANFIMIFQTRNGRLVLVVIYIYINIQTCA